MQGRYNMNLKELEYIVTIADEQRLARAAEKLYVTPSALTQQLSNIEHEIGTPLFLRTRSGWIPTEAGTIYLKAAREILQIRNETDRRLQDAVDARKGTLTIGMTSEHGSAMFTSIYPVFHHHYPEVTINMTEANVKRQHQMVQAGEIDLGFVTLAEYQESDASYIPLAREEILLAIPSILPVCDKARQTDRSPWLELDPTHLQYEPFAMMYKQSTMYDLIDRIFRESGFQPTVLFNTQRSLTALKMVSANICCTIAPSFFAMEGFHQQLPGISFFSMPSHPVWQVSACHKQGAYLTESARYLLQLAQDYWGHLPAIPENI